MSLANFSPNLHSQVVDNFICADDDREKGNGRGGTLSIYENNPPTQYEKLSQCHAATV